MQTEIYFIPIDPPGRLAQMPRPGASNGLLSDLKWLRENGIDTLVSMLQLAEERELDLQDEPTQFTQLGGQFVRHPIVDMNLPPCASEFTGLARALAEKIRAGNGVAIHCRAGIGRSGMLVCAVLVQLGMSMGDALEHIAINRGLPIPDTDEQKSWLWKHLA